MNKKIFQKAFTLVELLVVVAIVGTLATIVILELKTAQSKSRYSRMVADMNQITKATVAYSLENNGNYPADVSKNTIPVGMNIYMPEGWPDAPCDPLLYSYDYQNWNNNSGICGAYITPDQEQAVGVSYVKVEAGVPTYLYYSNVKNMQNCTMWPHHATEPDINSRSIKKLTCNE